MHVDFGFFDGDEWEFSLLIFVLLGDIGLALVVFRVLEYLVLVEEQFFVAQDADGFSFGFLCRSGSILLLHLVVALLVHLTMRVMRRVLDSVQQRQIL